MQYGIWNELKLETLTQEQKGLLGVKLSEFSQMTLNHLDKRIKKNLDQLSMEHTPNAVLIGLVSYALVGCVALVFCLWHIRQLHMHIQTIVLKHGLPMDTACRIMKDTSFPSQFRPPKYMPHWNVFLAAA